MRKKRSIWSKIFVLPAIPTIIIMIVAGALNILAFRLELYDARGAAMIDAQQRELAQGF